MKSLEENLKVEWVNQYLMPGFLIMGCKPSKKEKIEYFDLAMDEEYELIKKKATGGEMK